MVESAYTGASKASARKGLRVRVPLPARVSMPGAERPLHWPLSMPVAMLTQGAEPPGTPRSVLSPWHDGPVAHMTPDEFRTYGREVVEWIASYWERVESLPVGAQVKPGDVAASLPAHPPAVGEPFPEDFAERNGLGEWDPVAVVDGLA